MTTMPRAALALAAVLLTAGPAAANQPPGPQMIIAEIAILPLMILLSLAGGAYAILHALQPARKTRTLLTAGGAVLAILFSATSGGIAVIIAAIFAALALQRGVQMVYWGFRARSAEARPAHLVRADPRRLLPAGAALIALTLFLLGMAVSFAAYWPVGEAARQQAFRRFVAHRIAAGRLEQAKTGRVRYAPPGPEASRQTACPFPLPTGARVEYASDGSGFTLLMLPKTAFPFFPYNYLTSQPSYRADETGQIRMIEVHDRATACPPDGPVVAQVSEADIEKMRQLLEGQGECP